MSNTIIIDLGSQTIRFGLAGNNTPPLCYTHFNDIEIVERLDQNKTVQRRQNPIKRGKVVDWGELQTIFEEAFDALKQIYFDDLFKDVTVLVTHPLNTQANFPFEIEQILFEYFGISRICLKPQPLMALFQCDKSTGYVVQSGSEITQIVCYNQKKVEQNSIQNVEIGGIDVTNDFNMRFHQNLYDVDIEKKKQLFEIPIELHKDVPINSLEYQPAYFLNNDNQIIEIGNERFYSTELLFTGTNSITAALTRSIGTVRNRNKNIRDIYVCGGNSFIKGFTERIKCCADSIQPNFFKVHQIQSINESFCGANTYAGLPIFKHYTVGIKSYEDGGTYLFD